MYSLIINIKLHNVAIVVAKFATAANTSLFDFGDFEAISTKVIVKIDFKTCSKNCDLAVMYILFSPLQYPLITDETDTKKIAGDKTIKLNFVSGICKISSDIKSENKNNDMHPKNPIVENKKKDILKIL